MDRDCKKEVDIINNFEVKEWFSKKYQCIDGPIHARWPMHMRRPLGCVITYANQTD